MLDRRSIEVAHRGEPEDAVGAPRKRGWSEAAAGERVQLGAKGDLGGCEWHSHSDRRKGV